MIDFFFFVFVFFIFSDILFCMWYEKGLKFKCTECGKCCTGFEGLVHLTQEDIDRMCAHLKLSEDEFKKKYCRLVDHKWALLEDKTNFDCVFYHNKKCTIYQARPTQCQTYPFWPSIMKSKKHWEEEKEFCEGIEHNTADLISLETIKKKLKEG